jgi:hypothetical protein
MSLESYFKNGWLKKEATSPQEIADQLGLVSRCMKDASVEGRFSDLLDECRGPSGEQIVE